MGNVLGARDRARAVSLALVPAGAALAFLAYRTQVDRLVGSGHRSDLLLVRSADVVAALQKTYAVVALIVVLTGLALARIALENARLSAELSRSRARTAEERRRIERDLHDGAQQRLVTLALELRAGQERVGFEAGRLLDTAVDELQAAVAELRELARGVHPALLTERGLAAALESLAIRAPLPVVIAEAPARRFSAEVEAAAYFVASEGFANVVKHACAGRVTIAARQRNGSLLVEVADDGVGGAGVGGGSGLRGLADRVEALGGAFAVESPAGGGTRLQAEIPCAS